jgi:hypothetical protein
MLEAIKHLLDSGILNEDTKQQIVAAWDSKLEESREQIRTEMRGEFAERYEHDKQSMVEALDRMVTDHLTAAVQKIAEERNQLVVDRAKFISEMKNKAGNFEKFMQDTLAAELKEFANDRNSHKATLAKLEKFVVRALAEELTEFTEDKRDLVETKVKLVSLAKSKMESLRKEFIDRSATLVENVVTNTIKTELGQLKEDIKVARENNFGRRLFEAFASEYSATYLNENAEVNKMQADMAALVKALAEAKAENATKSSLVESKNREIAKILDETSRSKKLGAMLKPLAAEKADVMKSLLENIQTDRLEAAFNKYLPAVLNNSAPRTDRKVINESVAKTGDRVAKTQESDEKGNVNNIVEIKRLAGLK